MGMLDIILWSVILVTSIAVLVKGSDEFIEKAEIIGLHFRLSPLIIGITILSIGTSIPELITSIMATLKGDGQIIIGNAMGSNITNILLIMSIVGIYGSNLKNLKNIDKADITVFIVSAILLTSFISNLVITKLESFFLVLMYAIYIGQIILKQKKIEIPDEIKENKKEKNRVVKNTILLILSLFLIYFSAKYVVESIIRLSIILNITSGALASTAVALGTTLPELMIARATLIKGKINMLIGNIIGSNIFNTLIVVGVPGLIREITVTKPLINILTPVMIVSTILMLSLIKIKRIGKPEGLILGVMYLSYIVLMF